MKKWHLNDCERKQQKRWSDWNETQETVWRQDCMQHAIVWHNINSDEEAWNLALFDYNCRDIDDRVMIKAKIEETLLGTETRNKSLKVILKHEQVRVLQVKYWARNVADLDGVVSLGSETVTENEF